MKNRGKWGKISARTLLALLENYTLAFLCLIFGVGIAAMLFQQSRWQDDLSQKLTAENAKRYSEVVSTFRRLYTDLVVNRVQKLGVKVTHEFESNHSSIPLPATFSIELGRQLQRSGSPAKFKLYSEHPFPWREDQIEGDAYAHNALAFLQASPNESFLQTEHKNNQLVMRYATADVMQSNCVTCHNTHPDSPKIDWKVGDVRGVLEVELPISSADSLQSKFGKTLAISATLIGMGLTSIGLVYVRFRRDQSELNQRNEALEQSNSELKQFAYVASHDLQSPLRSMVGFAEILKEDHLDQLDENAADCVNRIDRAGRRMQSLIKDLLTFSRVENEKSNMEPVDLNEVFCEVCEIYESTITKGEAKINSGKLPTVYGNRGQFLQLLQNLVGNGIKYRGEKLPQLDVSALEDCERWTISVKDNGIGIDSEHCERVFEIFHRLHSPTAYPGTGIGLSVCRKIVQRHGGKIWIDSTEGQGTTVSFDLPKLEHTALSSDTNETTTRG